MVPHHDGGTGQVDLPVAIVSDRHADGRIGQPRIYSSSWPLTGRAGAALGQWEHSIRTGRQPLDRLEIASTRLPTPGRLPQKRADARFRVHGEDPARHPQPAPASGETAAARDGPLNRATRRGSTAARR
jgi:hypothetical protein